MCIDKRNNGPTLEAFNSACPHWNKFRGSMRRKMLRLKPMVTPCTNCQVSWKGSTQEQGSGHWIFELLQHEWWEEISPNLWL